MKKKIASVFLCICLLFLSACSAPTITMCAGAGPQPEETVEQFFACLKAGDYAGADSLIQNLSTLGMNGTFSNELHSQMARYLTESRSYTTVGECVVQGHSAEMTISLTVLDFRKVESTLTETTTAAVSALEYEGTEVDDAMLDGIIQSSLAQIMAAPTAFYSTEEIDLQLRYEGGRWLLICSDELYSALIGHIV